MYLIDTDIIIYSLKKNPKVIENFKNNASKPKSISVISYGELYFGAKKSEYSEKNLAAVKRIAETFPIIHVSRSIIETFGGLKAKLQSEGKLIADLDLIVASTALNMNYIVVTNNVSHFKRIPGLVVENWSK